MGENEEAENERKCTRNSAVSSQILFTVNAATVANVDAMSLYTTVIVISIVIVATTARLRLLDVITSFTSNIWKLHFNNRTLKSTSKRLFQTVFVSNIFFFVHSYTICAHIHSVLLSFFFEYFRQYVQLLFTFNVKRSNFFPVFFPLSIYFFLCVESGVVIRYTFNIFFSCFSCRCCSGYCVAVVVVVVVIVSWMKGNILFCQSYTK